MKTKTKSLVAIATFRPNPKFCNLATIKVRARRVRHEVPSYTGAGVSMVYQRELQLTNTAGETSDFAVIPAMSLVTPERFREWLLRQGNYCWYGDMAALLFLHQQMSAALAKGK